jgi:ribonuclease BN (tRNA processing enzyme)
MERYFMRVIFLGTNGWYDTQTGNTLSILIGTESQYIVLDAGNGIYKLDRYINDSKPIYLFLSHFHLDHIMGLHALGRFEFVQGLRIFGGAGTRNLLSTIINSPFTIPLHHLKYRTDVYELPEDQRILPFKVTALPLKHSTECLGFRFELENRVLSYCTDTGYCDNAVKLARDADLLITECALKTGQSDESWPHLNPQVAARIACEGKVKQLALVHFDAGIYTTLEERKQAEEEARGIFGNTFATVDDLEIEI